MLLLLTGKSGHLVTPFLDDSRATNVISGDTFQLNCSVVYPAGSQIDLEYVFPHSPGVENVGSRLYDFSCNIDQVRPRLQK